MQCGKMVVLRALIKESLQAQQVHDDNDDVVSQMISIMNNIIRRRENPLNTAESQSATMSTLAAPLIGNIASYLHQQDYARFGLVSRNSYIACNNPNTLRDLNMSGYRYKGASSLIYIRRFSHLRFLRRQLRTLKINPIAGTSEIDIRRYSQLRTLRLSTQKLNSSFLSRSSVNPCSRLTKLELDNDCSNILPDDFGLFMELQPINFSQITHLTLRNFSTVTRGRNVRGFRRSDFLRLLSLFPNLQSMHLYAVYIQRFKPEQLEKLKELLQNLEVFVVRAHCLKTTKQIISVISKQLRAFCGTVDLLHGGDLDDGVSFNAVEEISIAPKNDYLSALKKIIRNGSALKRVCLDWSLGKTNGSSYSLIPDLISKESGLEQLVIGAPLWMVKDVCTAIEKGICGIKEERYGLQIKLWIANGRPLDAKMVINCIFFVVDRLLFSPNVQHFVFIWRFWNFENKNQHPQWIQFIEQILQSANLFDVSYDERNILITNKGCQLAGQIQNYMTDDWMTRDF